jgi:hypothetical protein
MLCFRCEHRAVFLSAKEKEQAPCPRWECGDINTSKIACYMYMPVKPVWTKPLDSKDKRPRFAGAMFSQREKFDSVATENEIGINALSKKNKVMLYWDKI